jgi:hypothetical protein
MKRISSVKQSRKTRARNLRKVKKHRENLKLKGEENGSN